MATNILHQRQAADEAQQADEFAYAGMVVEALSPLASLKLTVVLMALAIFLILAGTLAQIDKDIWQVMAEYFRTPVAWIDLRVFFRARGACRMCGFPFRADLPLAAPCS